MAPDMQHPSIPPHIGLKPMADTPEQKVAAVASTVKADLTKADATATSWLIAHAHAFVTGTLVVAVLYILHKIL
jgi:hypothetical protein